MDNLLLVGVVGIMILLVPIYHYYQQRTRLKRVAGKIYCRFLSPAGTVHHEFCPVRGVYVYRFLGKNDEVPKSVKHDQIGREVYILKKAVRDYDEPPEDEEEDIIEGQRGSVGKKKAKTYRNDLKQGIDVGGRPHMMWPIGAGGFFSPQVSVPYAEFVEGFNQEVDSVSVALKVFEADPDYIAATTGNIVDEKLTALAAWFSDYIEKLQERLSKMINPNMLYAILGIMAVLSLGVIGLVWQMKGEIAKIIEYIGMASGGG